MIFKRAVGKAKMQEVNKYFYNIDLCLNEENS